MEDFPAEVRAVIGAATGIEFPDQGCTSTVVFVESERGAFAVKRTAGPRFCAWLEREHLALHALAPLALPTPRPVAWLRRETAEGPACWLVMERLPGVPLRTVLASERDAVLRRRLLRGFGATLARIHASPVPPELADDRPWLRRMLDEAAENLASYPVDGTPDLLARLEERQPEPTTASLIHGDFTLDNALVVDGTIAGVIDWPGAAFGDPRYDLALATIPEDEAFSDEEDRLAFYEGYGASPLTSAEVEYFVGLYEFF